jgi:hypothetical protein
MSYHADFDLHVVKERNERIRREVQSLRLEKHLRQNGDPRSGAGLVAFVSKSTLPLLRGAGLVG